MKIIDHIRDYGLDATIEKFSLNIKTYSDKILLKYSQIESPMQYEEVQECRGLILTLDGLNVISYPFKKFFNHGEVNAANIDFNTAICLDKIDGTFINIYHHNGKWNISTTGMAEAEGQVSDMVNYTFSDLFKDTVTKSLGISFDEFTDRLSDRVSYFFELTIPYNIVVTNHSESKITLTGGRDNITLSEIPYDDLMWVSDKIGVPLVGFRPYTEISSMVESFEKETFEFEGYVIVDRNFNRLKVKNPKYVSAHHTRSRTASHHIMDVIKNNEIDEYASIFKERSDELYRLKANFDALVIKLQTIWSQELSIFAPSQDDRESKKNFAMVNQSVTKKYGLERFTGLFFNMASGKTKSPYDAVISMDNKELYNLCS